MHKQALARGKHPAGTWLLHFLSDTFIFKISFKAKAYALTKPNHTWNTLGTIIMRTFWCKHLDQSEFIPAETFPLHKLSQSDKDARCQNLMYSHPWDGVASLSPPGNPKFGFKNLVFRMVLTRI
jgi:hypothetical protein